MSKTTNNSSILRYNFHIVHQAPKPLLCARSCHVYHGLILLPNEISSSMTSLGLEINYPITKQVTYSNRILRHNFEEILYSCICIY